MISPEVAQYSYRAIINYLGGNFEEYERLVDKAIRLNNIIEDLVPCKYKINGAFVQANINFRTGEIFINGECVRRGIAG